MRNIKYLIVLAFLTPVMTWAQDWQSKGGKSFIYELETSDTATNTETLNLDWPANILDKYYYSVQVRIDQITGTSAGNIILQQSNSTGGDVYSGVDTTAISGSTTALFNGTIWNGAKLRVQVAASGTHTSRVRAWAILREH